VAKVGRDGRPYPNVTEALNTPVQGTAADGLKAAIGLLWERRAECPGAVPVIFCHDEIVIEVPEADTSRAVEWLKRAMVDGMAPLTDPVPVEVEVTVGPTWAGGAA
jgi:DNA polymerase-1